MLFKKTLCFYEEFNIYLAWCRDCRGSTGIFVTRISGPKEIVVLLRRKYNIYRNEWIRDSYNMEAPKFCGAKT